MTGDEIIELPTRGEADRWKSAEAWSRVRSRDVFCEISFCSNEVILRVMSDFVPL
jgi:hypothetical protein